MPIVYDINMGDYLPGGRLADNGCDHADKVLSRKSKCTQCPFKECVKSMNWLKCLKLLAGKEVYA